MPLSLLWSAQVSDVFVLLRPLLSFFRFQGFAYAFEDAVLLLVVASLHVIPVLVVICVALVLVDVVVTLVIAAVVFVAVVIVIILSSDKVLFLHAPYPIPAAGLAVVALFVS